MRQLRAAAGGGGDGGGGKRRRRICSSTNAPQRISFADTTMDSDCPCKHNVASEESGTWIIALEQHSPVPLLIIATRSQMHNLILDESGLFREVVNEPMWHVE